MRDAARLVFRSAPVLALVLLSLPGPGRAGPHQLPSQARNPATTNSAHHFPPDEEVELLLRYLVEDGKAEGVVVGFLEADSTTRIVSYGDPGPGARPLGPQSVFELGSVGKTFTATVLSDMVLRGEVALDDPLSEYLPDSVRVPSFEGREITLLDLATHRSGLPKNVDTHRPADPENPWADFTAATLYEFLASYQLHRKPGSEFEYSNLGFQLLGQALAHVAGTSYGELLTERVLIPLGMTDAGFTLDGERAAWDVRGFRAGAVVPYWGGTDARLGAGGMLADMNDMLKYLKANVGPPESELERAMRVAQEPRRPWGETGGRIGLAWRVDSVQGRRIVQHAGNTGGFSSLVAFDPDRRVGLVWLTNTYAFSDPTPLELLVFGERPRHDEVRLAPGALSSLAGHYQSPSGSSFYVRMEDEGYLTLQVPRGARVRMYAESDSSFTLARGPARVVFETTASGEVASARLEGSGSVQTAVRVGDQSPPPRAVAAGTGWHQVGFQWKMGYWGFFGVPILLALLTLGAEVRRRRSRREIRG